MKNNYNTYVIDLIFDDGNRTKYVIQRTHFRDAKNEARELKDSWNFSNRQPAINDFSIKEIKNEDTKRKQDSDNPRHSSKFKVRKHHFESDEEYS